MLQQLVQAVSVVGALMIALIVGVAVLAPAIAPYGPLDTDYTARLQAPGPKHPFGTDNLGRDIFSRVLHGASIDLQVGLITVLLPFLIGVNVLMLAVLFHLLRFGGVGGRATRYLGTMALYFMLRADWQHRIDGGRGHKAHQQQNDNQYTKEGSKKFHTQRLE